MKGARALPVGLWLRGYWSLPTWGEGVLPSLQVGRDTFSLEYQIYLPVIDSHSSNWNALTTWLTWTSLTTWITWTTLTTRATLTTWTSLTTWTTWITWTPVTTWTSWTTLTTPQSWPPGPHWQPGLPGPPWPPGPPWLSGKPWPPGLHWQPGPSNVWRVFVTIIRSIELSDTHV